MTLFMQILLVVLPLSLLSLWLFRFMRNRRLIWAAGDLKSAYYYQSQGDLPRALSFYDKVVQAQPAWGAGHLGRARILLMQQQYAAAAEAAQQAEEALQQQDGPLAQPHQLDGDFRPHINVTYNEVPGLTSGSPRDLRGEAAFIQGIAQFHLGKLDDAINAYERCLMLEPSHWNAYLALAEAYLVRGDYPQAAAIGQVRGNQTDNRSMAANLQFVRYAAEVLQGIDPTEAKEMLLRTLAREDYYVSWTGLADATWAAIERQQLGKVATIREAQGWLIGTP